MKTKTSILSIVLLAVMMIAGTAMADVLSVAELRESGEESRLAQFSSTAQATAAHRYLSSDTVDVFESAIVRTPEVADT